jgi:hypothetical protein
VLACITCEKVILFTRIDNSWEAAHRASGKVIDLILHVEELGDRIVNLFIPTVCSSCVGVASWTSLSMNRNFLETWQPHLEMRAVLGGSLLMLGSSISLVHYEDVRKTIGSDYMIRSVAMNPSPGHTTHIQPYLQSGFL